VLSRGNLRGRGGYRGWRLGGERVALLAGDRSCLVGGWAQREPPSALGRGANRVGGGGTKAAMEWLGGCRKAEGRLVGITREWGSRGWRGEEVAGTWS